MTVIACSTCLHVVNSNGHRTICSGGSRISQTGASTPRWGCIGVITARHPKDDGRLYFQSVHISGGGGIPGPGLKSGGGWVDLLL